MRNGVHSAEHQEVPLYKRDYYAWVRSQVDLLRRREFDSLDNGNVAEELDDLGKSVRRELESRLERILAHLLKWSYQPERRSPSISVP